MEQDLSSPAIDAALIARLIAGQFPDWAGLPLRAVASAGTDNSLFRLGDDLVVRLPRVDWATEMAAKEQRWLPTFAHRLPLAVPEPMGLGEPAEGYPWRWSVYRWLEGRDALAEPIADDVAAAPALAGFVTRLQAVDTLGAPVAGRHNNYRGVALRRLDARLRESLAQLEADIDTAAAARLWEEAIEAPEAPGVWIHGDLLPGNLLVRDGRLAGVIDFGLLGVGDPSVDLMAAWTTFGGSAREAFIAAAEADEAAWRRARGWALWFAALALPYYRDRNPVLAGISRRTLAALLP